MIDTSFPSIIVLFLFYKSYIWVDNSFVIPNNVTIIYITYPAGKSLRSSEFVLDEVLFCDWELFVVAAVDEEEGTDICGGCSDVIAAAEEAWAVAAGREREVLEPFNEALCVPGTRVLVPFRIGTFTLVEILRIILPWTETLALDLFKSSVNISK